MKRPNWRCCRRSWRVSKLGQCPPVGMPPLAPFDPLCDPVTPLRVEKSLWQSLPLAPMFWDLTERANADACPCQGSTEGSLQPRLHREGNQASTRGMTPAPPGRHQEALEVLTSGHQQALDVDVRKTPEPEAA